MGREWELRIDVTDAVGLGEPAHITATIVLPDPELLGEGSVVCFAKPGGSYSRGYYTCELPGPASPWPAHDHDEAASRVETEPLQVVRDGQPGLTRAEHHYGGIGAC